jgi:NADH:ubiquinone oxidoreductase subunit F (NADH-binding)/(2Fe-2S) ferredoxin/Pyruvate/2-oxoacid:ferredoxin oxidoreductase delta subunit
MRSAWDQREVDEMTWRRIELMICAGTGCVASGAFNIKTALESELEKQGLQNEVSVVTTGCNGFCGQGPLLVVMPDRIFYGWLKPEDVPLLVEEHFLKGRPVLKLMFVPPEKKEPIPLISDIPFFQKQVLVVLRNKGIIDPEVIWDYIARDGYVALEKVLTRMKPEDVVEEVTRAGLRGRGGAGFPTGIKWKVARADQNPTKYLIGNCDEGDPGAYMDRSLLESDPHSLIEGMTIAAYAIGVTKGYLYIRTEYPLAIKRMEIALSQGRDHGLLGEGILGTPFSFDMEIREGSGAFVCGEETSLIHSIEGESPEPRQRPPFPAQAGLWGYPTVINNVETLANVPVIISRGAGWFSSIGTPTSKGTKIFSLVGKINNTGLIEVPMGITLREIIYDIGEGIPGNKKFKAVQTGGPSGGCIPSNLIDLPIDYDSLKEVGSIMGSGGMIVMDEETCMVDVAKFFIQFTNDESCGKCTTCRDGSEALLEVLTRISKGQGREGDVEFLEELSLAVKDASMCGLGTTLPNPVLSTIKYFKDEYLAHIHEKSCPALVCKDLIKYHIQPKKCVGCMLCLKNCPVQAITGEAKHVHIIDQAKCTKCGTCLEFCPAKVSAIVRVTGEEAIHLKTLEKPIPTASARAST